MALRWSWAITTSPPLALSAPCRVSGRTKWVNPVTSGCCLARLQGMPRLPRAPLRRDSPSQPRTWGYRRAGSPPWTCSRSWGRALAGALPSGCRTAVRPRGGSTHRPCGAHTGRAEPRAPARDAPPQRGKFSVAILSPVSHRGWFPCDNNHASSRGAPPVRVSSCPGYWRQNHGNDLDQG